MAKILELQAAQPEISQTEIAKVIGCHPKTVSRTILRGVKEGRTSFEEPLERIRYEIVPKVVDNLQHFLNQKDKQVTIEVAKGTIFKSYQAAEGISDVQQMVLALKIEMPTTANGAPLQPIEGQIIGKPRELPPADDKKDI